MFQRTEKKRTKPPLLAVGARVGTGLDQVGEKTLRQVLCFVQSISFFA
jgi:hypothetical protein